MNAEQKTEQLGVTWNRPTTWGVTWCKPQGVTWVIGLFVAASLLSTTVSTAAPEAPAVGVVGTSMVEMLATGVDSGSVSLAQARNLVLNGEVGDGSGVDVALIDTGVAPVDGLLGDKILHGPDLSFESANREVAYIDTYGHGTHMAGIIAGDRAGQEGVAPGARIVSVKVAGSDGLTTVPQVVAAIDWVVEHRNTDGLNIRVLNLSLGQQGVTTHVGDPLSAAVERAWDAGIFVVVAAGNNGTIYSQLDSPAIDPYVMAVGAVDSMSASRRNSMSVPGWTAIGNGLRNPDSVAAGRSIVSYRVPGSTVDLAAPSARVGTDLFKGSGSSQAAAAVSGAAAAMISARPQFTNDDLKATIKSYADDLRREPEINSGKGVVDAAAGMKRPKSNKTQTYIDADGFGTGIIAPSGATWSGGTWSDATWSGGTWSGATWSGGTWSGATWSGATWSGATWSGATWSGGTWSGATWSGATWSGATWSGATWSGTGWVN